MSPLQLVTFKSHRSLDLWLFSIFSISLEDEKQDTSRTHRVVGVVGDPLQFWGGREVVGQVPQLLQLLKKENQTQLK